MICLAKVVDSKFDCFNEVYPNQEFVLPFAEKRKRARVYP